MPNPEKAKSCKSPGRKLYKLSILLEWNVLKQLSPKAQSAYNDPQVVTAFFVQAGFESWWQHQWPLAVSPLH